ncbi:endo alpha-1,4 polygalactosaminidase [Dactylosporangium sp. NPDC000555]|uniref:endo alpha-1,4 polygalactosaminidase n=1 Tax=Dactylosporangium sp. NPDC000555 TaxID=3154260 RepID=UPI00331FB2B4
MNGPDARRRIALAAALVLAAAPMVACRPDGERSGPAGGARSGAPASGDGWVYQLQGYERGGLAAIARAPQRLAVIDLARDAKSDLFRPDEIAALRASGKRVLAYFEIGSIEQFRPEYGPLRADAGDLVLNRWNDWPDEHFVRYWDERWWDRVVRPRVDRALAAGFDGVYLDTPLAYEEVDPHLVPGWTRDRLARAMVDLIVRISGYARQRRPGFWVVPQNSPELRRYPGYVDAIDGIGMEELFVRATDEPCTEDFCAENLADTRALRDEGKVVLAVDYAQRPANVRTTCRRYREERFLGTVTTRELDRIAAPCG